MTPEDIPPDLRYAPRVGDKVTVVRSVPDHSCGWRNEWYAPGMDPYIGNGRVYTVSHVEGFGVSFAEDGLYRWPPHALHLVERQ